MPLRQHGVRGDVRRQEMRKVREDDDMTEGTTHKHYDIQPVLWRFMMFSLLLFMIAIWIHTRATVPAATPCCSGYPAELVCQSVCAGKGLNYSHFEGDDRLDGNTVEDLKCVCDNWRTT